MRIIKELMEIWSNEVCDSVTTMVVIKCCVVDVKKSGQLIIFKSEIELMEGLLYHEVVSDLDQMQRDS